MTVQVTASSPANGLVIDHVSPVTGRVVSTEAALSLEDSRRLAARAAAAFPAWSARSPQERGSLLSATADLLEQRKDAFCEVMAQELGTPWKWACHNVEFAGDLLRGAAAYAGELSQPESVEDHRGITSLAERVPCGVCLGIAPWNAPLILGVRSVAAPLLCGNTALLKGSEFAPRTFRMLGDAFRDAGIPKDVLGVFLTRPEDSELIVEALIATPVVRRVNFTGSTRVGRRVAELCAQNLKRPLLELGGQAVMIVLEDADLDAAAEAALWGGYVNQGQVCMSTERVVAADAIADRLIEKIEAGREKLKVGDPSDRSNDLGPVISRQAAERLSGLIGDAVGKGAVLIGGGEARLAYFEPALVDRVEPDMRLYREEVFGPILSVTRVRNDLEAVTVANDSDYGLSAAVFGGDPERAESIARRIHSGICHINRPTVDDNPHAPFGGVKNSGYGRFGGRWALNEFTELRWITRAAGP
jgi:benzaldehyde dehydrogenase (NAD)